MIDINDNEFRLLKMTASMLNRTNNPDLFSLNRYKELATSIFNKSFTSYIDKVKNYKHSFSLEEEYLFLEELDNEYTIQEELQKKLLNEYSKYTTDKLMLNDLSIVLIEDIRNRKNLISGYLINLKNINEYQKKIENNNYRLISLEKEKNNNNLKFKKLEQELIDNFLNVEGRLDKDLKYVNISIEYDNCGFNLRKLLSDNSSLNDVYNEIDSLRHDKEELLETARICYDNIPSVENKNILDGVKLDTIKIRYKYTLICIIKLLSTYTDNYNDLVDKRENLLELLKNRKLYINKLGINYVVDPFSRLKIREQLDYIKNNINDNTKDIIKLRRDINDDSNRLNDIINNNSSFLKDINVVPDTFLSTSLQINNLNEELIDNLDFDKKDLENLKPLEVSDNLVVNIRNKGDKIDNYTIRSKANSVINHVYDMLFDNYKVDKNDNEVIRKNDNDSNLMLDNQEKNIFCLTSIEKNVDNNNGIFSSYMEDLSTNNKEIGENTNSSNLFEDHNDNPFGNVFLFNNKTQENDNDKLPDVFWDGNNVQEDTNEIESLDDQIKRLKLVS